MNKANSKWAEVKKYCTKVNNYLLKNADAVLFYEGAEIPFIIVLDEENQEAKVRHGYSMFLLFSADPNFDEGAYTPIDEVLNKIKKDLVVYKRVNIR